MDFNPKFIALAGGMQRSTLALVAHPTKWNKTNDG
jgi:hypothetical protein